MAIEIGGMKKGNKAFLITMISIGLILSFFLSSIGWGMEGFLERYWLETQQINSYLTEMDTKQEALVENRLLENSIDYQKLYIKDLEEEKVVMAISNCEDEDSYYYVKKGYLKTVPYNLYRWGSEAGETYSLKGKKLRLDVPMEGRAFQLISYQCLVNYEDWKGEIDDSYTVAFGIHANKEVMTLLTIFAEKEGIALMTASPYMIMVKDVYAQYLIMLKVILLMISVSILVFVFVSILSSVNTRRKEFYLYRGCGGSWQDIKRIVLIEYLYVAFMGICVSSSIFAGFLISLN